MGNETEAHKFPIVFVDFEKLYGAIQAWSAESRAAFDRAMGRVQALEAEGVEAARPAEDDGAAAEELKGKLVAIEVFAESGDVKSVEALTREDIEKAANAYRYSDKVAKLQNEIITAALAAARAPLEARVRELEKLIIKGRGYLNRFAKHYAPLEWWHEVRDWEAEVAALLAGEARAEGVER